jgi:hypothetical protein
MRVKRVFFVYNVCFVDSTGTLPERYQLNTFVVVLTILFHFWQTGWSEEKNILQKKTLILNLLSKTGQLETLLT